MPSKQQLEERISELERALEEARDVIDSALGITEEEGEDEEEMEEEEA